MTAMSPLGPTGHLGGLALPWPALREDLRLHPGPADPEGHPTWTLHDPVRHRFVQIDWTTWEILRRWWLGDAARIADEINRHTTLHVEPQDVDDVLALARREELVLPAGPALPRDAGGSGLQRGLRWLLHNYLFFRIPLVRPDRLLAALLPWLQGLGSTAFTRLTALALLGGLFGVAQQTEQIQAQWVDMLSWRGLLLYGATLSGVKLAHELGHALVARHFGCRVPTMGVAFMVMWPVAYTDTTEAWRLPDRRARRAIAAAGVRTELTLAAWSTLAWSLMTDGPWRTAAFVLGTMTWISTVLVNLSPFMRFDGYFLLCDTLNLPNLHERSFAQARSWLRRTLLGWAQEPPEHFDAPMRRGLVAFALVTWAWRLSLYLGIAWTVYAIGFKALGIGLLMVELGWFILAPIARELAAWRRGWPEWRGNARARWSAAALLGALGLACLPIDARTTGAAVLQPAQMLAVRLPAHATLDRLLVHEGQAVPAASPLLEASTPDLARQAAASQAQVHRLERDLATAALDREQQVRWSSLQAELATARAQVQATQDAMDQMRPLAPFDAVVTEVHPGLQPGQALPPARDTLVHLASPRRWSVVAYLDEAVARELAPGRTAQLGLDAQPLRRWPAHVVSVAPQPSATIAEPMLVQAHGGLIDAREASGGWVPSQSLYRVVLALDTADGAGPEGAPRRWRGHVVLDAPARSLAARAWTRIAALWVREAGF